MTGSIFFNGIIGFVCLISFVGLFVFVSRLIRHKDVTGPKLFTSIIASGCIIAFVGLMFWHEDVVWVTRFTIVIVLLCAILPAYIIIWSFIQGHKCGSCGKYRAMEYTGRYDLPPPSERIGVEKRFEEYRCKYCRHTEWCEVYFVEDVSA